AGSLAIVTRRPTRRRTGAPRPALLAKDRVVVVVRPALPADAIECVIGAAPLSQRPGAVGCFRRRRRYVVALPGPGVGLARFGFVRLLRGLIVETLLAQALGDHCKGALAAWLRLLVEDAKQTFGLGAILRGQGLIVFLADLADVPLELEVLQ